MHYVQAKSILSANNGMNLYRGCSHGCIYCDSRSNCYNMDHDFEDIEIKENSIKLLKQALLKKKEKCMVGMGSMTDPYIPIENKLKFTQSALELVDKYNFGCTLITKSDLVLRDLELFKKINDKTKAVLQMTITIFDDNLCKIIEPNVAPSSKRFEVLKRFNEENIPTIVWLCPILPFINDTNDNLENILDNCIEANVKGILFFNPGVTLREGNREYFYKNLDENFPGLKKKYIETYGNSYSLSSPNSKELIKLFHSKTKKHNIMNNTKEIFDYLTEFPQNTGSIQSTLF